MGISIGNMFYGTDGYMEIDGDNWKAFRKNEAEPFAQSKKKEAASTQNNNLMAAPGGAEHYANFLDGIRNGNAALHCDIEAGYISSALPLLANISYNLGRNLKFDGKSEKFVNDKEANKMLTRDYRKGYVVPSKV
jgi:hypothetical protein